MCFGANVGLEVYLSIIFGIAGVLADSVQMKRSYIGSFKAAVVSSFPPRCLGMARVFQTGFRQVQKSTPCKIGLFTASLFQRKKRKMLN